MREYELVIDEAFKNGLTPELMTPFNTQLLYECLGFRCGKLGLEAFEDGDNPLPVLLELLYEWPYPQFITGDGYNFLIVRDSTHLRDNVYRVSDNMTTATLLAQITNSGTLMEVADFGEYVLMVNGYRMLYLDIETSTWTASAATTTIPMMRTICNFKGQAIGGGITSAWHDCDETFYVWSKIGHMDFTPDASNEAGYRRCPYGGNVYHVKRIGGIVIGYSSKGITQMTPVDSPMPTYEFSEVADIGLINRGAVGGNLSEHVFVDSDYNVWKVMLEYGAIGGARAVPKKLGYRHYMQMLKPADGDIIVLYDHFDNNFYIGNSEKTFLLSPYGMTEIPQHPSAVWRITSGSLYMLPDAIDSYSPLITTEIFDMGYKGQKTTQNIETDAMYVAGAEAGVDYANDLTTINEEVYRPINNMGSAAITVAGNLFRFRLRFTSIEDNFRIGYMKVRYKMTDLRNIRGVYAPPLRGQS